MSRKRSYNLRSTASRVVRIGNEEVRREHGKYSKPQTLNHIVGIIQELVLASIPQCPTGNQQLEECMGPLPTCIAKFQSFQKLGFPTFSPLCDDSYDGAPQSASSNFGKPISIQGVGLVEAGLGNICVFYDSPDGRKEGIG